MFITFTLNNNYFTGSIQTQFFSNFNDLEIFNIQSNYITGNIQSNWLNEPMTDFIVSFNQFSGSLTLLNSSTIYTIELNSNFFTGNLNLIFNSLMPSIFFWNIDFNFLSGTLPMLNKLTVIYLFISNNLLIGKLSLLYSLTINYFDISYNQFIGKLDILIYYSTIPSMNTLALNNNQLTGLLPLLDNITIGTIYLNDNQFTGTIPSLNNSVITNLDISNNLFTGTIPLLFSVSIIFFNVSYNKIMGNLNFLINSKIPLIYALALNNNHLTGSLPIINSHTLYSLDVSYNQIYGNLNLFIESNIPAIVVLALNNNQFTGTLPLLNDLSVSYFELSFNNLIGNLDSLSNSILPFISTLYLSNNLITGSLPVLKTPQLTILDISFNIITGNLNSFVNSELPVLSSLNINNNQLSGSIPNEISKLINLTSIGLSLNCITGLIPKEICSIEYLQQITMDGLSLNPACEFNKNLNKLSQQTYVKPIKIIGSIPECFFNFIQLKSLHMSGNSLTGKLSELNTLSLVDLSLSNNQLTGTIPISIQTHEFNVQLLLSNNQLTGTLINDFMITSIQQKLSLTINRLSGSLPNSFYYNSPTFTIDVLNGNLFSCKKENSLPSTDPSHQSYTCGSNNLNNSIATFLIPLAFFLIFSIFIYLIRSSLSLYLDKLFQNMWKYLANIYPIALSNKEITLTVALYCDYTLAVAFIASLLCIYCLLVLFPFNIGYSLTFTSKYQITYGWIISMVFIDGIAPMIIYGFTVIVFMCLICLIIESLNRIEQSIDSSKHINVKIWNYREYFNFHELMISLFILLIQTINLLLLIYINILYQRALSNTNYNNAILTIIQTVMSLLKVFWSSVIIPLFHQLSQQYITSLIAIQHRLFMLIVTFIIAPMIATLFINQSCFYYIWNQENEIESFFSSIIQTGSGSIEYTSIFFFVPSYNYSYNCSKLYFNLNFYCYCLYFSEINDIFMSFYV